MSAMTDTLCTTMANSCVVAHYNPKRAGRRPHTAPQKELAIVGVGVGKQIGQHRCRPHSAPEAARKKKVDELKEEDKEKEKDDNFFENKFLDSHYKIKDDVHKEFKSFFKKWLCYEYGITGPNEKIPRTHLYVTVKNGVEKSTVFEDLKKSFGCEPTEFFEIRDEPKTSPKFKFLVRPGEGIVAKETTQLRQLLQYGVVPGPSGSLGTLTMFCFQDNNHYALTCFHVVCQTDNQRFQEAFNTNNISKICESRSNVKWLREYASSMNYYHPDGDELGKYHKGFFDECYDIMSIKVKGDVQIDCEIAEIVPPSWYDIWKELRSRDGREIIVTKVGYSSGKTWGYIENLSSSIISDDGEDVLFFDVIKVKSNHDSRPFLEDGDSGALVSFLDQNNKQQAFAYAVGEWESFFICLRLDIALQKLNLFAAGCFNECARSVQLDD